MDAARLRLDFPLYDSENKDVIYLDNACQTLRPKQVIAAMDEYYYQFPACGGRSIHRLATQVSLKIDEAREKIAAFIGCAPRNIIFTKNCTEALNLAAKGYPFAKGSAVLTTDLEHNSNHVPWMSSRLQHKFVRTPASGLFDFNAYQQQLTKDVSVVSMVHTNNVTGTTLPAREIISAAHDNGSLVILDGAQSVPHQKIDVKALDVDMLAFSLHKMLGPSGVGVLYAKDEVLEKMSPLISGGGSVGTTDYENVAFLPPPEKFEAGLLNYSGIIGAGAAVDYLQQVGMEEIAAHEQELNRCLTAGLQDNEAVTILPPVDAAQRSGIFSFNIRGMDSHDIAMICDEIAGIAIRSGMHCAHPFFVARGINGCARASLYLYNTKEECRRFVETIDYIVRTFSS
ncbi:aminotransferase class V-fold PLP-dependent enzyme [Candidatus Methanomassiliicoccus intestinalis]|uniref:aminotransferase class V-fold PLP-dependent enzyme n=1 Tax=Candidatus Methanomassiliicoccus intestinalis TaxID=1406512 RepID=UPI0037DCA98B